DGQLSLSEVENALGASGGTGSSSSADATGGLASAFAQVDANGDGELSSGELANTLNQTTGPGQVSGHHGHHRHHHGGRRGVDDLVGADASSRGGAAPTDPTSTAGTTAGGASAGSSSGSTAANATSSITVSTLDSTISADVTQALQAFLSSLSQ